MSRSTLTIPNSLPTLSGGLRRTCRVCRIVGLAIVVLSATTLVISGLMSLDISLLAAIMLFWTLGAGTTLVILSFSALRQSPPPKP